MGRNSSRHLCGTCRVPVRRDSELALTRRLFLPWRGYFYQRGDARLKLLALATCFRRRCG